MLPTIVTNFYPGGESNGNKMCVKIVTKT